MCLPFYFRKVTTGCINLIVRWAAVIVAPAGMVMPVNRHAFHLPVVSRLCRGFKVMLTVVSVFCEASSALTATAMGPIVVAICNCQIK